MSDVKWTLFSSIKSMFLFLSVSKSIYVHLFSHFSVYVSLSLSSLFFSFFAFFPFPLLFPVFFTANTLLSVKLHVYFGMLSHQTVRQLIYTTLWLLAILLSSKPEQPVLSSSICLEVVYIWIQLVHICHSLVSDL